MDWLLDWDKSLFYWINQGWSNSVFDYILPILRNKYTWIPLYLAIIVFILFNFKQKIGWYLLFALLTIALSDNLSSRIIKPKVKRERPCQIYQDVNLLVRCGSGYSFTSSHATNHFAIGTFFMLSLGFIMGRWKYLFLFWAALVSIAQVYVGVHYPLDILAGAGVGVLCGLFVYWIYKNKSGLKMKEQIA